MMNFEKVKLKFEQFAHDEAFAFTVDNIPDLVQQNNAYDNMHKHVVPEMHSNLGIVRLKALKSPLVYRMHKGNDEPNTLRIVSKIVHYKHDTFKDVWVVYCSGQNESPEMCSLTHAYFMVENDDSFVIAREYLYSNYERNDFEWVARSGWQELTFESLGEIVEIERYVEPYLDRSKQLYLEDK